MAVSMTGQHLGGLEAPLRSDSAPSHCSYQLLGFEEIGVEIESPFGTDDNDIDLDAIVRDICVDMQARANRTLRPRVHHSHTSLSASMGAACSVSMSSLTGTPPEPSAQRACACAECRAEQAGLA